MTTRKQILCRNETGLYSGSKEYYILYQKYRISLSCMLMQQAMENAKCVERQLEECLRF